MMPAAGATECPGGLVVVGISDCAVSAHETSSLITYALGSCVAIAAWDAVRRVGGLLHIILPESSLNREKAARNPFMFADTGIPALFERLAANGADRRRCVVRLAGGAQVMDREGIFNIGKRNLLAVRKMLWKEGVLVSGEAVGGQVSRTVRLRIGDGAFFVREEGRLEWQMQSKGGRLSL